MNKYEAILRDFFHFYHQTPRAGLVWRRCARCSKNWVCPRRRRPWNLCRTILNFRATGRTSSHNWPEARNFWTMAFCLTLWCSRIQGIVPDELWWFRPLVWESRHSGETFHFRTGKKEFARGCFFSNLLDKVHKLEDFGEDGGESEDVDDSEVFVSVDSFAAKAQTAFIKYFYGMVRMLSNDKTDVNINDFRSTLTAAEEKYSKIALKLLELIQIFDHVSYGNWVG